VIWPWHRVEGWSPEQAAEQLHECRTDLICQLRRRGESSGVPRMMQEEIVDDAITAVVMSPRGIVNEDHLLGAFWVAVDHRCRRYHEGRYLARLGSRVRVDFDAALAQTTEGVDPFEGVEHRDRFARAADLMADLSPRERQVVAVMAIRGVGPLPTARLLKLPLGEVRSAARSASAKLDRVAVIAAAGRMCEFRSSAIVAEAAGEATEREARLARSHVKACMPCRRLYRQLRREMRGREFQRAATAAFLPMPAVSFGRFRGLGRVMVWIEQRIGFYPRGGGGERAAEVLGGAGMVKAAAAGTAVIVAGSALGGHLVHDITSAPPASHRHRAPIVRQADRTPAVAGASALWSSAAPSAHPPAAPALPTEHSIVAHHHSPAPPSKSLGYLALGGSSATSTARAPESSSPRASMASVRQAGTSNSEEPSDESAPSSETPSSPPQPSQSGGGTNFNYLGK
jgi:DNA-directed RNA polymerase specialized sigma24 family protein